VATKSSTISKFKKWANAVKKRDGYKCQLCNSKKNVVSHHINPFVKNEKERYFISNGQTLCSECHKKIKTPKTKTAIIPKNNTEWEKLKKTGETFGRWNVLNLQIREGKKYFLICQCNCGIIRKVNKSSLMSGKSTSCGCWANEKRSRAASGAKNPAYKHGNSLKGKWTKEYRCWVFAKHRCFNTNSKVYDLYGGRGIKMCSEWANDFECFLCDVGHAPSDKHELDRIDTNGNYEPNNCRWATRKEQMRNIRTNHLLSMGNKTKTIAEWSEITGINSSTLYSRKHYGWNDEECLKGKKNNGH
jgi:hypothetical protein